MYYTELGNVIQQERTKKNISREVLAQKINKTEKDIENWETGLEECPKELFVELADILKINENILWNALQTDVTGAYRFDKNIDFDMFDKNINIIIKEFEKLYDKTWNLHHEFLKNFAYPIFRYAELCEQFNIENKYTILRDFLSNASEEYTKNKLFPTYINFENKRINHNSYLYTLLSMLTYLKDREDDVKILSKLYNFWGRNRRQPEYISSKVHNLTINKESISIPCCGLILELYLDCLCKEIDKAEKNNEFYEVLDKNLFEIYNPINKNNKMLVDIMLYIHIEKNKAFYTPEKSMQEIIEMLQHYDQMPLPEILRVSEGRINKNIFNTKLAQRYSLIYEKHAIEINKQLIESLIWVK